MAGTARDPASADHAGTGPSQAPPPPAGEREGHDPLDDHGAGSVLHLCAAVVPSEPPALELPQQLKTAIEAPSGADAHRISLGLPPCRGPPTLTAA